MKMTDFVRKPFGLGAKNNVLRVLRKIEGFMLKILYPNITGTFTLNGQSDAQRYFSGAFEDVGKKSGTKLGITGMAWMSTGREYDLLASRSSSIYGSSTNIQPSSIRFYIVCRI